IHPDKYPFFRIYNAKTYAPLAGPITLNSGYLDNPTEQPPGPPSYIANYYPAKSPTTGRPTPPMTTAATNGLGSCIYETNTHSFWLAIPECWNQTAQLAYLTEYDFTANSGQKAKSFSATAGGGGDPNASHGCVAEINPTTGVLKRVFDVGAPAF